MKSQSRPNSLAMLLSIWLAFAPALLNAQSSPSSRLSSSSVKLDPTIAAELSKAYQARKIAVTSGNVTVRESAPGGILKRPGESIGFLPEGTPVRIVDQTRTSNLFSTQEWVKIETIGPPSDTKIPKSGWVYLGTKPNGQQYIETPRTDIVMAEFTKETSPLKTFTLRYFADDAELLAKLKAAQGETPK